MTRATRSRATAPGRYRRRGGAAIKILVALVLISGVALVAWFMLRGGGEESVESDAAPDLYEVARRDFNITSTASGELQAKRETRLSSGVESRTTIIEIVPEGEFVKKGELLVQLATEEIESQLIDEQLNLNSAQSALTAAEEAYEIQVSDNDSSLRQSNLKLELAKLELQKWLEGDSKERQLQLDLDLRRAIREEERLEQRLEKQEKLFERDFISSDELERDRIAYIEAESQLEKARLAKRVYEEYTYTKERQKLESDVEEAAAELERVKARNRSYLNSKQADVTNRKRQLAIREERVAKLEQQIESARIIAPTDGLVVYSTSIRRGRWDDDEPLKVGREVRHNEDLIVLPDTAEMVASIKIHESRIGLIKEGMPALVTIDAARGAVFNGEVSTIGVMAESGGWRDPNNREYDVKIDLDLDGDKQDLKPSMRCEAEVIIAEIEDVMAVPVQSVFTNGPVNYVYVSTDGRFRRTAVQIGRRSDTFAEIRAGLDAGQVVSLREPPLNRIIPGEIANQDVAKAAPDEGRPAPGSPGSPAVTDASTP